jgi:hypothetical protein
LQNAGGARHTDAFQGYAEAHGRDLHRGSSRGTQTYSPIAHRLELLWWRRDIRVFQQNPWRLELPARCLLRHPRSSSRSRTASATHSAY